MQYIKKYYPTTVKLIDSFVEIGFSSKAEESTYVNKYNGGFINLVLLKYIF